MQQPARLTPAHCSRLQHHCALLGLARTAVTTKTDTPFRAATTVASVHHTVRKNPSTGHQLRQEKLSIRHASKDGELAALLAAMEEPTAMPCLPHGNNLAKQLPASSGRRPKKTCTRQQHAHTKRNQDQRTLCAATADTCRRRHRRQAHATAGPVPCSRGKPQATAPIPIARYMMNDAKFASVAQRSHLGADTMLTSALHGGCGTWCGIRGGILNVANNTRRLAQCDDADKLTGPHQSACA